MVREANCSLETSARSETTVILFRNKKSPLSGACSMWIIMRAGLQYKGGVVTSSHHSESTLPVQCLRLQRRCPPVETWSKKTTTLPWLFNFKRKKMTDIAAQLRNVDDARMRYPKRRSQTTRMSGPPMVAHLAQANNYHLWSRPAATTNKRTGPRTSLLHPQHTRKHLQHDRIILRRDIPQVHRLRLDPKEVRTS
jgi:hypothetical protein